jgi:hypothetical protein
MRFTSIAVLIHRSGVGCTVAPGGEEPARGADGLAEGAGTVLTPAAYGVIRRRFCGTEGPRAGRRRRRSQDLDRRAAAITQVGS